jgi:putative oxidoreductase
MEGIIDKQRLIWPGLARLYETVAPYSYALIRFGAGAVMIYYGYQKLFLGFAPVAAEMFSANGLPLSQVLPYALGVVQLFGGAALSVGLLTRPIALLFAIEMVFAIILRYPSPRPLIELPALLLLIYLALVFRGAGRCSLDRMIGKEF